MNRQGLIDTASPAGASDANAASARAHDTTTLDHVAVLLLIDLAPGALAWGWSRVVFGRWCLRGVPGLCFAKALGSGHDGGFGLRPSKTRQGLFLLFASEDSADRFLADSPTLLGYRRHARELCIAKLRATSSRGSWGGQSIAVTATPAPDGVVAALTRASIRPSRAWAFWRHSPASETSLAQAAGCRLAAGIGEAPVLRQATFSVWDSQAHMDAYARQGAHLQAIHASRREGYFNESMFVRFKVLQLSGSFKGVRHG
jgi:hypothetical protein